MIDKEKVYDEQLCPLIKQVVDICNANGIQAYINMAIPSPTQEKLMVTTLTPDENGMPHPMHIAFDHTARGPESIMAQMVGDHSAETKNWP